MFRSRFCLSYGTGLILGNIFIETHVSRYLFRVTDNLVTTYVTCTVSAKINLAFGFFVNNCFHHYRQFS